MRKIITVSFSACLIAALTACGGGENANNANQLNTNTGAVTANVNTNAQPAGQPTPLPEFTDPETAYAEGNKLFDANQTEMAIEAYNQAVKLNPDYADAWFKLGISYALIEKQKEVDSLNEEITGETPTPTPAKKSRKTTSNKKEKIIRTKDSEKAFEKAVAAYEKIIKKNEKDDAAYYNMGRALNKLDEDEDAAKALKEAVKLKPEDTLYQTELGAILNKLAQYDEAVRALKKALEIDPDNSEAAELLEKAEAGKRRVNFGVTPKPPQQQPDNAPRPRPTKPADDASPDAQPKPEKEVKPSATKPPAKLDKKGDQ